MATVARAEQKMPFVEWVEETVKENNNQVYTEDSKTGD
jgi:hypothetical protein